MKANNNNAATQLVNSNESVNGSVANNDTLVYYSGRIGSFAKHTDEHGAVTYGVVDSIFDDGLRVGFVHSDKNTWTSELVWAEDITPCTEANEIEKARTSAACYYRNEAEDIRARIARHYEIDDEQKLAEMLAECESWTTFLMCSIEQLTDRHDKECTDYLNNLLTK